MIRKQSRHSLAARCVVLVLFMFDVIVALSEYTSTAKCNLLVK